MIKLFARIKEEVSYLTENIKYLIEHLSDIDLIDRISIVYLFLCGLFMLFVAIAKIGEMLLR